MKKYFKQYIRAVTNPLPEMQKYFDEENEYLKKLITPESIVLDVGCGNGRTMKVLAPHAREIVGIDYDSNMIKAAKANLNHVAHCKLVYGNFFKKKFNQQFDIVYASYNLLGSSETLIDNGLSILQKMVALTKPEGHTIASVWSDEGLDFAHKYYPNIGIKVKEVWGNDVITDFGIFKRFSMKELGDLSRRTVDCPYTIVDLNGLFYLLDIHVCHEK